MALFFDDEQVSVMKPFVNDYVTEQKKFKSEVFYVESIKTSKKGTGILLYTEAFIVFLFKNSKSCKRVIEIVESHNGDTYYPLIVQTKNSDPFYSLGLDDESTADYSSKKDEFDMSQSWFIDRTMSSPESLNPPVPHMPANTSQQKTSTPNSGGNTPKKSLQAS